MGKDVLQHLGAKYAYLRLSNCPRTEDHRAAASRLRAQNNQSQPWISDQDISIRQNKGPFLSGHDQPSTLGLAVPGASTGI
jgi:hypothetical protein